MSAAVARQLPPPPLLITGEYLEYNKGPEVAVTVATLVSIVLLTFLLRVYTSTRLLRYFGIDDWFMFIAVVCIVGILAIFISLADLGFGKHFWAIPFNNVISAVRLLWISTLLYAAGISFVKLSVALFLLRIIQRPVYRRLLSGTIVILAILTVVWFITLLFQCFPIEAVWDPSILHAKCMSRTTYRNLALFNGCTTINVATDIIFATMPIPIIWRLRVSLRTKVFLILVLSLGYTACAAAIVRIPLIYSIWDQEDPFAKSAWLFLWSVIEMAVGIIAACLPSLKPLLTAAIDALSKLKPSRGHSTTHRSHSDMSSHHHASTDRHGFPTFSNFTFPRPKNAYIRHHLSGKHIGLKTYHDPSSNVTFEIYDRPPRIPRTWSQHTRTPSGFSGFTNFSQPFDMSFYDIDISPAPRSRAASRGLSELESEIGKFRSGYAVSVTSGEVDSAIGGGEDAKTLRGVAGEEESVWGLRIGDEGKDMGRILRTTTTDVTIS